MNLLNPETLQQQLEIYNLKTTVDAFLTSNEGASYQDLFIGSLQLVAPDIEPSVKQDILIKGSCFDLNTMAGLNAYLRLFYLSLPFDTTMIRNYIVDVDYYNWSRYFVNIILTSYIQFYRGYTS